MYQEYLTYLDNLEAELQSQIEAKQDEIAAEEARQEEIRRQEEEEAKKEQEQGSSGGSSSSDSSESGSSGGALFGRFFLWWRIHRHLYLVTFIPLYQFALWLSDSSDLRRF